MIEDAKVAQYLTAWAELDRFYVVIGEHIKEGLIHYIDSAGNSFALMDDDDESVELCIKFLKKRGNPFFDNLDAEDRYLKEFKDKLESQS